MLETSTPAPSRTVEGVEIDKVAEYNGKPLFTVDLESLDEKPWRQPGTAMKTSMLSYRC